MRRTIVRAVLIAVLLAPAALVLGSGPAGAVNPTVTVTPSTGIADGQTITVAVSGSTYARHTVAICGQAFLDEGGDLLAAQLHCSFDPGSFFDQDFPLGSFTVPLVARQQLTSITGLPIRCGDAPYDCVVLDWQEGGGYDPSNVVTVPIDLSVANHLTVTPSTGLPASTTATVDGSRFAPGAIQLQQCTTAWAGAPDPATADQSCGVATAATVAGDGTFGASLALTDPLLTRSGQRVACGFRGCSVLASSATTPVVSQRPVSFGVPAVVPDQTDGLLDQQVVGVSVQNAAPLSRIVLGLCTASSDPGTIACKQSSDIFTADADGRGQGTVDVGNGYADPSGTGMPADCRVVSCSIVAWDVSLHKVVAESAPVTFGPRPQVTLTPSSGLLEGQSMAFHAANLPPNQPFQVARCAGSGCATVSPVTSSSTGTVDLDLAASDRVGSSLLCHDRCTVRLQDDTAYDALDPNVGYTMAAGSVTATPSTGLTTGQDVVITGTDLMATYVGRTLFFPTGGWAVAICEKAVGPSPTLVDLFVHCAVAPGGAHVDVPGSTSSTTVQAPATFTKILGGTVDCRTVSGGCVIGLNRWEQDGTLTSHFTPIAFAG